MFRILGSTFVLATAATAAFAPPFCQNPGAFLPDKVHKLVCSLSEADCKDDSVATGYKVDWDSDDGCEISSANRDAVPDSACTDAGGTVEERSTCATIPGSYFTDVSSASDCSNELFGNTAEFYMDMFANGLGCCSDKLPCCGGCDDACFSVPLPHPLCSVEDNYDPNTVAWRHCDGISEDNCVDAGDCKSAWKDNRCQFSEAADTSQCCIDAAGTVDADSRHGLCMDYMIYFSKFTNATQCDEQITSPHIMGQTYREFMIYVGDTLGCCSDLATCCDTPSDTCFPTTSTSTPNTGGTSAPTTGCTTSAPTTGINFSGSQLSTGFSGMLVTLLMSLCCFLTPP